MTPDTTISSTVKARLLTAHSFFFCSKSVVQSFAFGSYTHTTRTSNIRWTATFPSCRTWQELIRFRHRRTQRLYLWVGTELPHPFSWSFILRSRHIPYLHTSPAYKQQQSIFLQRSIPSPNILFQLSAAQRDLGKFRLYRMHQWLLHGLYVDAQWRCKNWCPGTAMPKVWDRGSEISADQA